MSSSSVDLGVPVLSAFDPFEYRSQDLVAFGFVLFEASRIPGYLGDSGGQSGSAFRRQDAPPEYPIRTPEKRVLLASFE